MWQQKKAKLTLSGMFLFTVLLIFAASGPVLADGKKQHQAATSMSDHMQAMQDLKQAIPEEYRIMQRTPIIPDEVSLLRGETQFQQNCVV